MSPESELYPKCNLGKVLSRPNSQPELSLKFHVGKLHWVLNLNWVLLKFKSKTQWSNHRLQLLLTRNLENVLIKPLPGNFLEALLGNSLYGPELELQPNLTWEVFHLILKLIKLRGEFLVRFHLGRFYPSPALEL